MRPTLFEFAGASRPSALLYPHSGIGDVGDLGQRFVACFAQAADDAGPDPRRPARPANALAGARLQR
jgi:hypothetical protein